MYAIVKTGGKQYRVEEGRPVTVERLPVEEGEMTELRDVLLIADGGDVTVGSPTIEGARVLAQVEAHGRGKKIIVFKYKQKVRTRKKTGHRQGFTRLAVQEILLPGQEPKPVAKPKRASKAEAEPDAEAEVETPAAEAEVETPVAEAVEAPARRTRRGAQPEAAAPEAEAPKARRSRAKAAEPEPTEDKPKRRTRKKADEKPE